MSSGDTRRGDGPRWTQTWLSGARSAGVDLGRPGERYGLPEQGSGSVAGYGRRLGALFLDWLASLLVAGLLVQALGWEPSQRSLLTLAIFGVQAWLLTALTGVTLGKAVLGLRTVRLDGRRVGFGWAAARAALLLLVVPALVWDRDYRGLHDRAANTIVVHR
ncbi:RDD family protein [Actinomadura flavalba]|uniref:RDD family protein n=1 Tax=Actinomadura flavalba TaxID=1120938 RepID=UPI000365B697|nr:RDD family protein [Actinomadura flavalba]